MNEKWTLTESDFGILWPYIIKDTVTDVDYNGSSLWICDLKKGKYKADIEIEENFLNSFCQKVANKVSRPFNRNSPSVEAETEGLRITILHESVARCGKVFRIRKTPKKQRLVKENMIQSRYASAETIHLLSNCVIAGLSIVICGGMGTGKTELIKYLTKYIPESETTITIEDTPELHFKNLHPDKDGVEIIIDAVFTFADALKNCLRLNAERIILSEARSREVEFLMENVSFGLGCMTSLHTDDVRNVPDRIKNMYPGNAGLEQIENDVFRFINVGVFLRKRQLPGQSITRHIEQVCFYTRVGNENIITMMVNERKQTGEKIPDYIKRRMENVYISDPYNNPDVGGIVNDGLF